jgi:hypothetical protein
MVCALLIGAVKRAAVGALSATRHHRLGIAFSYLFGNIDELGGLREPKEAGGLRCAKNGRWPATQQPTHIGTPEMFASTTLGGHRGPILTQQRRCLGSVEFEEGYFSHPQTADVPLDMDSKPGRDQAMLADDGGE